MNDNIGIKMVKNQHEITVLSRGGQGGILGNKLLGKVAFEDGFKDIIAIPIIGAERRGAPIRAYLRISNEKIRRIDAIKHPEYYLILDEALLKYPNIKSLIENTTVIINTEKPGDYGLPSNVEIYTVPATKIAIELDLKVAGQPIVNVAMIGAFAKVTGLITLKSIEKVILGYFGGKGELNYEAAKMAYNGTEKLARGN